MSGILFGVPLRFLTFKQLLKYTGDMSRAQAASDVFQAIADPTRREILAFLKSGERPVSELTGQFPVTMSAISQHMRVLREAGLVSVRPSGRERFYRINAEPLKLVSGWALQYEDFWRDKLVALGEHLENES